jgi:DNA helicase-2/ATP-dependent DNA helicase PcrA
MAVEIAQRRTTEPSRTLNETGAPVPLHVVAEILQGLNREQRAAVTHRDGPLLVIAGPGTGKTEVVTRRVAWLIATKRARPSEILALTFTDNAAEEMQSRVDVLVPYGQADAGVHTFHAFGDRLIREHAFELGLPGDVRLVSRAEAVVLMREHLFDLGLDRYRPLGDPTRFLGALVDLFGRAKDEDVSPSALLDFARRPISRDEHDMDVTAARGELAAAYVRYQQLMSERGLIDHGDQVSLALRLLRDRPQVREAVSRAYRYLLVDEFQDMNRSQIELVDRLLGESRNVTVVGDPDQAIYRFRGAAGDNIGAFQERHPDLRRVVLRRNYRSRQSIIDAAEALIAHSAAEGNRKLHQVANRRSGRASPVRSILFPTPEEEADGVAQRIAEEVGRGARPREFGVLARSNWEVDGLARSLRLHGIPVRTQLPADFFAQASVRPLLAFLRVVADPHQTLELYALASSYPYLLGGEHLTELVGRSRRLHRSLWEVLAGSGEVERDPAGGLARLVADVGDAIVQSHDRPSGEVLYHHLRQSGLLARLAQNDAVADARAVARFFEIVRSRASLLEHDRVPMLVPHLDALIEANDELADTGPLDADAVSVLTVHRAKGLEFRTVYLTGLTDGRFPARGRPPTIDLPWDEVNGATVNHGDPLDDERRLCYVAMTRARDELHLTHHVGGAGGRGRRRPSPFIAEAIDAPSVVAPIAMDALGRIEKLALEAPAAAAEPARTRPVGDLSFSEIESYLECPERYRLRHVVGLPSPVHHALTYGSAMHKAVAAFHLSRGRGTPLPESELLAEFRSAWSVEGFLSRAHEEARFAAGQEALRRFRREQLALPQSVIAVERPFVFNMDDVRVRGRVDRIDRTPDGDVIVDYKASDVRDQQKANQKARDSLQLQVYALSHEADTGSLPHEMQLHFLDSGVIGTTRPEAARLDRARDKIRTAASGIRAGDFSATPNSFACGYCPYRQICPSSAA